MTEESDKTPETHKLRWSCKIGLMLPIVAAVVQLVVWILDFHEIISSTSYIRWLLACAIGFCFIGILFCIASMFDAKTKKWVAVVGVVFNTFVLFQGVLVIFVVYIFVFIFIQNWMLQ